MFAPNHFEKSGSYISQTSSLLLFSQSQIASLGKLHKTVLGSFDIGHRIMRALKFFAKKMTVEMLEFWSFLVLEPCEVTGIFHRAEGFDPLSVVLLPNSCAVLHQHSHIKRNIVPDHIVRFFYIAQKMIDITIDIFVLRNHRFADAVYSLRKKINRGGDIDILIDSHFFVKFLSIKKTINRSKLQNLICRRKSGRFRIDKKESDSFFLFGCRFLRRRFLEWSRFFRRSFDHQNHQASKLCVADAVILKAEDIANHPHQLGLT